MLHIEVPDTPIQNIDDIRAARLILERHIQTLIGNFEHRTSCFVVSFNEMQGAEKTWWIPRIGIGS